MRGHNLRGHSISLHTSSEEPEGVAGRSVRPHVGAVLYLSLARATYAALAGHHAAANRAQARSAMRSAVCTIAWFASFATISRALGAGYFSTETYSCLDILCQPCNPSCATCLCVRVPKVIVIYNKQTQYIHYNETSAYSWAYSCTLQRPPPQLPPTPKLLLRLPTHASMLVVVVTLS